MDLMKNYEMQLVQRVKTGDRNAFREIVEDHKKKIFNLAYELTGSIPDAEDLSQEAFIKAYRGIGTFSGEASIGTWLHRITVNSFIDGRRSKEAKWDKVKIPLELQNAEASVPAPSVAWGNPISYAESRQIEQRIHSALDRLSPKERAVFIMRRFDEMPGKSVGQVLNISEGTVKALLFRAVRKLQDRLSDFRASAGREATS